jgi:rhodanese-related sulfurtransferase
MDREMRPNLNEEYLEVGVCTMPFNRISPQEANARLLAGESIVFIDARNPKAWAESDRKLPGAIRVPADDVESHLHKIDRNATIITYCT